jgi:acetyl esterase/lipase
VTIPVFFLLLSLVGAALTANVYRPLRGRSPLVVPSFLAGWLSSELAVHRVVGEVLVTLLLVAEGALGAWPGWLGLALSVGSWGALLALVPVAAGTREVMADALQGAFGPDAEPGVPEPLRGGLDEDTRPSRLLVPFLRRDPGVRVVRDLRYAPEAGRRHLLDVYAPAAGARGAPVLLQIHGGGWVIGHKREQALPLMLHLAARGWVCVAANYRLSPKATFPEHLVDCKQALAWVRAHVAEYGGDPDFVVVTGGSAGGHLSALLALTPNDPEYQPGFEEVDTRVQACVPFYGVYDLTGELGHPHFEGFERFWARMILKRRFADDPDGYRRASPLARIGPHAPPFFVVHGTHDTLVPVDEARGFVHRLREVSREPVAYAELPGAQHAFEVFHSMRTRHVIHGVARFLTLVRARAGHGVEAVAEPGAAGAEGAHSHAGAW